MDRGEGVIDCQRWTWVRELEMDQGEELVIVKERPG